MTAKPLNKYELQRQHDAALREQVRTFKIMRDLKWFRDIALGSPAEDTRDFLVVQECIEMLRQHRDRLESQIDDLENLTQLKGDK